MSYVSVSAADKNRVRSVWLTNVALVGGCVAVFVVALARPPLHLGIPGHRALFWLPPLLAAATWGPRGGGSLTAALGVGARRR